tara:strand:- start:198 stop:1694 length:1497 start_codon:yes stop_codon:yes gene_type:complete
VVEGMSYKDYNLKLERIANSIKNNTKLITTNRKGHNYRDLKFKKKQTRIETGTLTNVLELKNDYIDCESAVTIGKVNRSTIPTKRMIPSLPEGDNFTVGGCLAGLGLGSSSYLYGFFGDNVIDFDIILGNGEIIKKVSKTKNSDLYYGIGGTYGTMGIITRVKIKLIPCEKHVKVNYYHYNSFDNFYKDFSRRIKERSSDFIEAFANKKNSYTIVSANFISDIKHKKIAVIKNKDIMKQRSMTIYAQISNKKESCYLRLLDYLERYSYAAFWGHYLYTPYKMRDYLYAGLLYSLMPQKILDSSPGHGRYNISKYFHAANHIVGDYYRDEYVLATDIGVPLSKLKEAMELADKMTETYPRWICPINIDHHPDKIFCTKKPELCKDDIILDLGIYGIKNTSKPSKEINQAFERFSFEHGMFKGFFSTCYFTYEDFWNQFDKNKYDSLRETYHADKNFMNIFDKMNYRNKTKKDNLRSKLFKFFGKKYLKQINNNKDRLIK